MPTSTISARRARFFSRCPLALLVLLLAAGCRSSQSAYQFRPALAPVAQRLPASEPSSAAATVGTASEAALKAAPVAQQRPADRRERQPKPRQARQQLRQALARVRTAQPQLLRVGKSAGQAVRATAGPRQAAEVGLGTTVLGVLGLVTLPVALIGLLIWGGPVWAVLAGLAALAVLVAYLDPFG